MRWFPLLYFIKSLHREMILKMPIGKFFESQFSLANKYNSLKLTDSETALFTAIMILNPGIVYYIYITGILQVYYRYITGILQVYYMYITGILQVYYKFIICILHVYYNYIIFILQVL